MLAIVTWTNPTTDVDGNPLEGPNALTNIRIEWGTCVNGDFGTKVNEAVVSPEPSQLEIQLDPGSWCVRAFALNANGESMPSNVATKTVLAAVAVPPAVQLQETTVFAVVKRPDGFVFVAVGTAPAATECIAAQFVNGYYVVPRANVTWSGTVRPDVVVGKCSE